MCLNKNTVTSGSHGGTGKDGSQDSIASGAVACSARPLDRVSGVEYDLVG